MSQRNCKDT